MLFIDCFKFWISESTNNIFYGGTISSPATGWLCPSSSVTPGQGFWWLMRYPSRHFMAHSNMMSCKHVGVIITRGFIIKFDCPTPLYRQVLNIADHTRTSNFSHIRYHKYLLINVEQTAINNTANAFAFGILWNFMWRSNLSLSKFEKR